MTTTINMLDVPEIRRHRRQEVEGGVVIAYETRQPGERNWQPVKLFRAHVCQEPHPRETTQENAEAEPWRRMADASEAAWYREIEGATHHGRKRSDPCADR